MPLSPCDYRAPWWLPGGHLQTLIPRYVRRLALTGEPIEIELKDDDVLYGELHRSATPEAPLLILSHGLEGSARSGYILGATRAALAEGWSVLAWNLRSCGDRLNRTPRIYHSGCSDDLDQVIGWAEREGFRRIRLAGFSLGGNVTLKWLGEQGEQAFSRGVERAVAASVPLDLLACVRTLERPTNWLYHKHFVRSMKRRLLVKAAQFPGHFDLARLKRLRTLWQLDEHYTAPLNGFRDAADYYARCSGRFFLSGIRVPTLLVTARNDPFFDHTCFPVEEAERHPHFAFEAPATGGHVGFWQGPGTWWLERRLIRHLAGAPL